MGKKEEVWIGMGLCETPMERFVVSFNSGKFSPAPDEPIESGELIGELNPIEKAIFTALKDIEASIEEGQGDDQEQLKAEFEVFSHLLVVTIWRRIKEARGADLAIYEDYQIVKIIED